MRNTGPEHPPVSVPAGPLPHIDVACGVLQRADGRVLIAQRPAGKIAAGKWEFPGGKIEAGESSRAALDRELAEELGVSLQQARPLIRFTHAYYDRIVTLETWLVTAWTGEAHGRESQCVEWHAADSATELDVLPTVAPILRALLLPTDYAFTPPQANESLIRDGLLHLPRGALLRLRLPALSDAAYTALARRVLPDAHALGLRVILDRGAALAQALGAAGWHQRQDELMACTPDPSPLPGLLRLGSCHDHASLAQAKALGCDAAVLGAVRSTFTHPEAPTLGWKGFAALAGEANLPVYALGGVGPRECAEAFAHHAQGVAGISAYWSRSEGS